MAKRPTIQPDPEEYFTIRLPRSLRERLNRLAERNDRTASAEARIAIRDHTAKAEPE